MSAHLCAAAVAASRVLRAASTQRLGVGFLVGITVLTHSIRVPLGLRVLPDRIFGIRREEVELVVGVAHYFAPDLR